MTRARDLADSADKDIAGTLTLDDLTTSGDVTVGGNLTVTGSTTGGGSSGTHTGDVVGNVTGNLTGDVTGDVTGNLTGNVTGDVTGNILKTGDLTLDASGDIILDADAGDVFFNDAGVTWARFQNNAGDLLIESKVDDKDMIFRGVDGGTIIAALTLDMSDGGKAAFNAGATFGNNLEIDAGSSGMIDFGDLTGGYGRLYADSGGTYIGSKSNNDLILRTNNVEKVRVDTSGNLLVGKNSTAFGTEGVALRENRLQATNTGNAPLELNRLSDDGDVSAFYKDGASVGSIKSDNGKLVVNSSGSNLVFAVGGTAELNTDGSQFYPQTDNTHNLGIGSNRFKDLYLSGGIYFQGSTTPVQFDDYEEGAISSTNILQAASSTPTYSVNANRSTYTKIGRLVHAHFDFSYISLSGGSGDVYLNLPFTVNSTDNYHSVHAMRNCSAFASPIADHKVHAYGSAGTTILYLLYESGNAGAETAINTSMLQNGRINLDFTYTTAT